MVWEEICSSALHTSYGSGTFLLCAHFICAEVRADSSASFTTLDNVSHARCDVKGKYLMPLFHRYACSGSLFSSISF